MLVPERALPRGITLSPRHIVWGTRWISGGQCRSRGEGGYDYETLITGLTDLIPSQRLRGSQNRLGAEDCTGYSRQSAVIALQGFARKTLSHRKPIHRVSRKPGMKQRQ